MPNKGLETPAKDVLLTPERVQRDMPGFVKATFQPARNGQFAKTLASAFLKFTEDARALMDADSVQSFIALSELHRELAEEAQAFLLEEVPFVYEDQQIQPLLVNFAAHRLKHISRRYYFATLQSQPKAILDDLKAVIQQRQAEYEAVLHTA